MSADTVWYFAYGSNMTPAIFVERRRMRPLDARPGWIDGYELCFDIPVGSGERGVANLAAVAAARTHGVAYLLHAADAAELDRTEGVSNGLYYREPVDVVVPGNTRLGAFTYRSTISLPGRKPSPRYVGLLLEGARLHGLPAEWVAVLEALELAVDERPEHER